MSEHVVDIDLDNAQQWLIDESLKRPVLADFWASWCEPCKSLMPILENLATQYDGGFLLAKINADEQQMLASQFGVRSLPTVMLIKDGQPVDGFTGLQSEVEIRQLLDKYLPKPWDTQLQAARSHMESGQHELAYPLLLEAYTASNQQADIAFALVETLTALKRYDQAEEVLAAVKMTDQGSEYEQLRAALGLAREAQKAPELQALESQLASEPENQDLAFQLAVQYSQHSYHQQALELLYRIIRGDLNFHDGEAKKIYLDILAVLGKGDPVAADYQRKLYTLLY